MSEQSCTERGSSSCISPIGWLRLGLNAAHLHSHDLTGGLVDHLVDGAVRPAADLPEVSQILCREVAVLLRRELQLSRRLDTVCPKTFSAEPKGSDQMRWSMVAKKRL